MHLPQPFIDSISNVEGLNMESFLQVHEAGEPVTSVRINDQKKPSAYNFDLSKNVSWCPYGFYLDHRPFFTMNPLLHAGAFYVQEASSMFLWHILQNNIKDAEGIKVLDLCAAPGGKSTLLAQYFSKGFIVNNEVIKSRAAVLKENCIKWGFESFVVTSNDPEDFKNLPAFFNVMVIDAPCSGSGLFRKDSKAVEEWSLENVLLCSKRQKRILLSAIDALADEGLLIYSTCSYSKEENEMMADFIMENYSMQSVKISFPAIWNIVEVQSEKKGAYGYRFFPDKVRGEGFFVAVFKKMDGDNHFKEIRQRKWITANLSQKNMIAPWLQKEKDFSYLLFKNMIHLFPSHYVQWLNEVSSVLQVRHFGVEAGEIKHDFIPAHHLAMSNLLNEDVQALSLNQNSAIDYLKKREIAVEGDRGWTLVTYNGINLGWIKILNNRINNYYPVEWRILKD